MEDSLDTFQRLALQIERGPLPVIPFVGQGMTLRCNNPPAPQLELVLKSNTPSRALRIGSMSATLPANHVGLHNVHFGNASDPPPEATGRLPANARTWCLFLDISRWRGWSDWSRKPRFVCMPARNIARLKMLFEMLALSCRLADCPEPKYLVGRPSHDPSLPGHDDPVRRLRIRAALLNLLAEMVENARQVHHAQDEHTSAVRTALQYMRLHFADPALSLDRIARETGLSVDHFGLIFRQQMACPPMRYLRRLRMEEARRLLAEGRWLVGQVARSVGYADPLHFSRVYRQEMGHPPRQEKRTPRPGHA